MYSIYLDYSLLSRSLLIYVDSAGERPRIKRPYLLNLGGQKNDISAVFNKFKIG